eukprot:3620766-Rhodomonas_salina.1
MAYKFVALLRNKDEFINALNQLIIQLGQALKVLLIDNKAYLHIDVNCRPLKKLSETSVVCVFLGFATHLGHKGYLLKALNHPRYFIWHVKDKHHHLTFELLEDHDRLIEPVTPANIEIILEDEDKEKGTAQSLQTIDALEVHTRVMKRARSEGENEGDRVVGSTGSGEEQVQQINERST